MPTRPFNDSLLILYRAFFRAEVQGLENLNKVTSPTVILALNHVSFLDAGIALSLLGMRSGFRDRHHDGQEMVGAARSCA